MLPDRVSNPGPLTYESCAYRLRYAARQHLHVHDVLLPCFSARFKYHIVDTVGPVVSIGKTFFIEFLKYLENNSKS